MSSAALSSGLLGTAPGCRLGAHPCSPLSERPVLAGRTVCRFMAFLLSGKLFILQVSFCKFSPVWGLGHRILGVHSTLCHPPLSGGGVTPCPRVCSLLSLLFLLGSRPPGTSVLVTRCGSLLSGAVMRMSSPMNTGESPHHSTSSPTRAIIELLRFYQFDQCKMAFSCCFNSYGMKPTAAWDVLREGHRCPPVLGPRHGVGNGNR